MKVNLYHLCRDESIQSCDCKMYNMIPASRRFFVKQQFTLIKYYFFIRAEQMKKKINGELSV